MKDEEFFALATKYLSREASLKEREHLISLLKQKKYSATFDIIKETWLKSGKIEQPVEFDIRKGINLLTDKIRNHIPSFRWDEEEKHKQFFSYRNPYFRIAASIAFIVFTAAVLFTVINLKPESDSIVWNEKKTSMGEHIIFNLLDGTRITLNAGSKLMYPVHFGEESREVHLEGEAYFEITHSDKTPFVVYAGNVKAIDLGTKFNVKAFPNENNVIVSLEEGKVEVSLKKIDTMKENAVLLPAQQLIYDKEEESSSIDEFDILKTTGWKDNILIFDDEPLSAVLVSLERHYGVKFEVADESLIEKPIKADFRNESFWTVVKVIEKATGLKYTISKENDELNKIVFYQK
ncbi:MAG: FecR domain-containing protein [Bacteroidetes bacterium]|nr:FecR domain-containing protein [Bacteroidota bacterium]